MPVQFLRTSWDCLLSIPRLPRPSAFLWPATFAGMHQTFLPLLQRVPKVSLCCGQTVICCWLSSTSKIPRCWSQWLVLTALVARNNKQFFNYYYYYYYWNGWPARASINFISLSMFIFFASLHDFKCAVTSLLHSFKLTNSTTHGFSLLGPQFPPVTEAKLQNDITTFMRAQSLTWSQFVKWTCFSNASSSSLDVRTWRVFCRKLKRDGPSYSYIALTLLLRF